jgi:3-hydroxymyristoyl/3-hydroxydecanoyl-(acyl carrier protein) dehydratase
MSIEPLPHGYPFRFVDRTLERRGKGSGRVTAVLSGGGRGASGGALPTGLLAELMAQAALLLSGTDPEVGRSGFLAGLSDLTVARSPGPGDALTVTVAIGGRMGPVVKFDASVFGGDGVRIAGGSVTVRQGSRGEETEP